MGGVTRGHGHDRVDRGGGDGGGCGGGGSEGGEYPMTVC
jgi:hypothetical protein